MKEKKQDKSIRETEKNPTNKKRFTKGKTNPIGTAFDLTISALDDSMYDVKPRASKKQAVVSEKKKEKSPIKKVQAVKEEKLVLYKKRSL